MLVNKLYKLFYIEEYLTCQQNDIKKAILDSSVYIRWANYGTLYAATHHSLVGIIGTKVLYLATYFLTQYVQMAILCVAQRTALLLLAHEASCVADGIKYEVSEEDVKKIEVLQSRYVKTQSQLLIAEVTIQEQGVELYEIMQSQLGIKNNKRELDGQMDNMREMATFYNERLERQADEEEKDRDDVFNYNVNLIAIVFAVLGCFEFIVTALFDGDTCKFWIMAGIYALVALCVLIFRKKRIKVKK